MQQTFSSEEVKTFRQSVNTIVNKATWPNLSSAEILLIADSIRALSTTGKIMEDHVMEHVSTTSKPEEVDE